MSARMKDGKQVTVLLTLRLYSNRHVKLETNRETLDTHFGPAIGRKGKGKQGSEKYAAEWVRFKYASSVKEIEKGRESSAEGGRPCSTADLNLTLRGINEKSSHAKTPFNSLNP